jgi:hypothetical protein
MWKFRWLLELDDEERKAHWNPELRLTAHEKTNEEITNLIKKVIAKGWNCKNLKGSHLDCIDDMINRFKKTGVNLQINTLNG